MGCISMKLTHDNRSFANFILRSVNVIAVLNHSKVDILMFPVLVLKLLITLCLKSVIPSDRGEDELIQPKFVIETGGQSFPL